MASNVITVQINFVDGMTNNRVLLWIGFRLLNLAARVLSTKIVVEAAK